MAKETAVQYKRQTQSPTTRRTAPPAALALAWIVPGAGHWYIGRPVRALVLFGVIHALFWSGMALGGAFTVNPRDQVWWFRAQALTGANWLAGWALQESKYRPLADDAQLPPLRITPAGAIPGAGAQEARRQQRAHEQQVRQAWEAQRVSRIDPLLAREGLALVAPTADVALLFTGVAGMLNLLCIFDALLLSLMGRYGEPRPATEDRS